jgi:hypothetical protein
MDTSLAALLLPRQPTCYLAQAHTEDDSLESPRKTAKADTGSVRVERAIAMFHAQPPD